MPDSAMRMGFNIEIFQGDALEFPADVLVVKDWRSSSGLDTKVRLSLQSEGFIADMGAFLLGENEYFYTDTHGAIKAGKALIIGPTNRPIHNYTHVRELATDMLRMLKQSGGKAKHIATTLQGVNTGRSLDERESFRSMLLGFSDAYEQGEYPPTLELITFVDRNEYRVELMQDALQEFLLPTPSVDEVVTRASQEIATILAGQESFAPEFQRPEATDTTPHIFVAMPFAEDYDDQFYLAIRPAVQDSDHLCIRLDQNEATFTGDIVEQVKERIRTASLVIALLDGANPNVYLEVGYAWGVGTPTMLIIHKSLAEKDLPFDIRGQKYLVYDKIYKLKDMIAADLKHLLKK
ncbi:MAG: hypothetical protein BroJett018_04520 [Chloroflexota bacterium]|nr:hypothetical protein [Chloroflexota bacterium]GIK62658.1 MAG: hypothetical protein BroJett018_04520 [Chloroflexota bacterium]